MLTEVALVYSHYKSKDKQFKEAYKYRQNNQCHSLVGIVQQNTIQMNEGKRLKTGRIM